MNNEEILNKIQNLDLKACLDAQIQEYLTHWIKNGIWIMQYKCPKGEIISRIRSGSSYYSINELSYCPVWKCTKYQRATLPNETIFYGFITDDSNHLENARAATIAECSPLCRRQPNTKGIETYTCSQWKTNRDLLFLGFFSDLTFTQCTNNRILKDCSQIYFEHLRKTDAPDTLLDVSRYLSQQFMKRVDEEENWKYKITANLVSLLRHLPLAIHIDGIIYPSSRIYGNYGVDVALFPESADEALVFDRKMKEIVYVKNEQMILRIEGYAKHVEDDFSPMLEFPNSEIFKELKISSLDELRN